VAASPPALSPPCSQYLPPAQQYDPNGNPIPQDEDTLQAHFEEFYEDIFEELLEIGGELEQLRVCENLSDHLSGNVYAKFREEEDAEKALKKLFVRAPVHSARRPAGPGGAGVDAHHSSATRVARRVASMPAGRFSPNSAP